MKKVLSFLIIITSMFFITGCWDMQDLEKMTIPIVGGYDINRTSDINTNQMDIAVTGVFPVFLPDVTSTATVAVNYGKTIGDTRTKRSYRTPKSILYGLLQSVVYGDELASAGLKDHIDIILRNPQVKLNIFMMISEGRADELLKTKITTYPNIGIYIKDLMENSPKDSFIEPDTLHHFAVNVYTTGNNPVLPLIKAEENTVAIIGLAIFKKDKLIAKTDLEEAKIITFLRGDKIYGYLPFTVTEGGKTIDEGTVHVKNSRSVTVARNGNNYIFQIKVKLKCDLTEHYSSKSIENKSTLKEKIEKSIKNQITAQSNQLIQKMQKEYKTDCIDITRFALAKWRNELFNKCDNGFIENVKIMVQVDVNIVSMGELE